MKLDVRPSSYGLRHLAFVTCNLNRVNKLNVSSIENRQSSIVNRLSSLNILNALMPEIGVVEFGVVAALSHELIVTALLNDFTFA